MTGHKLKVPAQAYAPKDAGGLTTADFISEETEIDGNGAVIGTLHFVTGLSSFGGKDGCFMPTLLDDSYSGKEITVTGVNGPHQSTDLDWLVEVRDNDTQIKFEADGQTIQTLTFQDAALEKSPVGKKAIKALSEKTDFGGYGKAENFWDDMPTVTWNGKTAKVIGALKKFDGQSDHLDSDSCYFPVVLSEWFSDKNVSVYCKNETEAKQETDWIVKLEDNTMPITVKYEGDVIALLDVSGLTVPGAAAAAYAAASAVKSTAKRAVKKAATQGGQINA